jgi:hypothetical protein
LLDFYFNICSFLVSSLLLQPDQWGIPKESYTWMDENYFKDRANIAKNKNKPLILEEYGMRREGERGQNYFLEICLL